MTADAYGSVRLRTGQMTRTNERQVQNSAGGYVYQVDDAARLVRFLTLGAVSGTYYVGRDDHLKDNVDFLQKMAAEQPKTFVSTVLDVSRSGRAPRQQPGLFALAIAASSTSDTARQLALSALPAIARTGSTLLTFVYYVSNMRGWGRGLRRALGDWYLSHDAVWASLQVVKYRNRSGWTHGDVLRVAHPQTAAPDLNALFRWTLGKEGAAGERDLPELVGAFEALRTASVPEAVRILSDNPLVTWEFLPDNLMNEPEVWDALLHSGVPLGALMRQLPRLTRLGLLSGSGEGSWASRVSARLTDAQGLAKARLHPLSLLLASRTYGQGRGRGSQTWTPVRGITEALERGFYAAYGSVVPVGGPVLLALDVSGSMSWGDINGTGLTPREASAALALITANVEGENAAIMGFSHKLVDIPIRSGMTLTQAVRAVSNLPFGGTDTSLPWELLTRVGQEVAGVVTYTDSETWAGGTHTENALRTYRERVNPLARSVVVGLTSTGFTIADPNDMGSLDIAGMDASTPTLISEFLRGGLLTVED